MNHSSINCKSNVAKQKNVTTGKVYRQMFDAEVQLVSSLLANKCGKWDLRSCVMAQEVSSPFKSSCAHENDLEKLKTEVLVLPDIVPKNTSSTNILERIKNVKSSKHQEAIDNLKGKMLSLGEELKRDMDEASDLFLLHLSKSHSFVKQLIANLDDHEALNLMSLAQLHELWKNVSEEDAKRNELIKTFEEKMMSIEKTRMLKMLDLFNETHGQMGQISYKSDPELDKFIADQTKVLSKTMISNKREYSRLITSIKLNDYEFEQDNLSIYKERIVTWKDTQKRMIVGKFSSLMDGESMKNPPQPQSIIQEIIKKQSSLNERRVEVFLCIKNLSLFDVSKKKLNDLKDSIFEISKDIDQVYEDNFKVICSTYEGVHCMGVLQYQNLKSELIDKKICTERQADDTLKLSCHHLLVSQKEFFEKIVGKLDRDIGKKNETSLMMLKALFDFCDVVVDIWTEHKEQMSRTETLFKEELSELKAGGFESLQNVEAELDLVVDKLRQSSSLETLKSNFEEVQKLVHRMMTRCQENYKIEVESLKKLGPSMSALASAFIQKMLNHLGKTQVMMMMPDSGRETIEKEKDLFLDILNSIRPKRNEQKMSNRGNKDLSNSKSNEEDDDEGDDDDEPTILLCYLKDYSDLVEVKVEDVVDAKDRFEENVLTDLNDYLEQVDGKNGLFVGQQTESLTNELELQIHVYEGRLKRLKENVFDVRRAEIELHSRRFESHKKHALRVISESKYKIAELLEEQSKSMKEFKRKVELQKCEADTTVKSSRMKKIMDTIKSKHELLIDEIKTSARKFVSDIDCSMSRLHASNLVLDGTLILFTDGGNFCLDEIKNYKQEIARLTGDVISCEESIMRSLEGVESKQYQQSLEVVRRFEAIYGVKTSFLEFEENCEILFRRLRTKLRNESLGGFEMENKLKKRISFMSQVLLNEEKPVGMSQYLNFVAETNQLMIKQASFLDHNFENLYKPSPSLSKTEMDSRPDLQSDRNALVISQPQKSILNDELMGVLSHLYGSFKTSPTKTNQLASVSLASIKSIKGLGGRLTNVTSHENETTLIGKMNLHLKECFKNIRSSFEMTYEQHDQLSKEFCNTLWSGSQNKFDETMISKMNEFHALIIKYHHNALQEFKSDLRDMEDAVLQMFVNTMRKMSMVNVSKFNEEVEAIDYKMIEVVQCSNVTKAYHLGCLRPSLGHPQNEKAFEELRRNERTRSNNLNKSINRLLINKLRSVLSFMPKFLMPLMKFVENSFKELDKLYFEAIEDSTESKNTWSGLFDHEIYKKTVERITTNMSKMPNNEVTKEGDDVGDGDDNSDDDDDDADQIIDKDFEMTSLKKTQAHASIHKCAVNLVEEFFIRVGRLVSEIETVQNERNFEKKEMDKYWFTSIKEIKSLYV